MIFAAAYLIIYFAQGGGVMVPYHSIQECQSIAQQIVDRSGNSSFAYCIEGDR